MTGAPAATRVPQIVLAHDGFADGEAKTAEALIRYASDPVAAVVDRSASIDTAEPVVGPAGRQVPVVATMDAALDREADRMAIGVAPVGGRLPDDWRPDVEACLLEGLDVVAGLHDFLGEDEHLARLADENDAGIHDLRRPPTAKPIYSSRVLDLEATVVLTVGTDCSSGKMTTSVELVQALGDRGHDVAFAATGQTGLMIGADSGVVVDAVPADFVAGWGEKIVLDAHEATDADVVVAEGQGALSHPAYAAVSLGLLHGTSPDACVLCHDATRKVKGAEFHGGRRFPVLDPAREWHLIEAMAEPVCQPELAGVSVMNGPLSVPDDALAEAPHVDVLQDGAGRLAEQVEAIG
jgi:uncharacterized NAD-dependent epimerase/dehydratase family protein